MAAAAPTARARLIGAAGVAPEALSAGSPREATMARRAEARTAVVAGADLRLAEATIPCRPRHADIARNDLSKSALSPLAQGEKSECASRKARGRRGLGALNGPKQEDQNKNC